MARGRRLVAGLGCNQYRPWLTALGYARGPTLRGRLASGLPRDVTLGFGGPRIMVIFRLISLILVAAALMLLGYDALNWINPKAGATHALTSLNEVFVLLGNTNPSAEGGFAAGWPEAAKMVLSWPAWAVLGVVGLIFAVVFRRRG